MFQVVHLKQHGILGYNKVVSMPDTLSLADDTYH